MKQIQLSAAARRFVLLTSALVVAACSKSSSPTGPGGSSSYYFRFNANGSVVNYTSQPSLVVAFGHSGSQFNALITGFTSSSNANVQVFSGSAIGTVTYSGYNVVGGAFVGALVGYQDASGTTYTSGSGATDAVVTITQLTSSTMTGTFTGRLKATGKADIVVTNGEFFVKRAN